VSDHYQKWTCKPRRGIIHLARYVLESESFTGGLFDTTHPMYRGLNSAERRELISLWRWLHQQDARQHESAKPLSDRAVEPPTPPEPPAMPLFDGAPQEAAALA